MKRNLLVIVFLMCLSWQAIAQNPQPFRLGLTFSPSGAWMKPETVNYISEGWIPAYGYGIVGDFRLGDFYAVSTGLQITQLGGKLKFRDELPTYGENELVRDYRLQYLEIPVSIKLHTMEIGYFTYFAKFGLAPGINLKAKATDEFTFQGNLTTTTRDIKSDTPLFRAALVIGLGTEYSLGGRMSVLGGLTYNNGFSNTLKGRNAVTGVRPSAGSNYIMLNVGLLF